MYKGENHDSVTVVIVIVFIGVMNLFQILQAHDQDGTKQKIQETAHTETTDQRVHATDEEKTVRNQRVLTTESGRTTTDH